MESSTKNLDNDKLSYKLIDDKSPYPRAIDYIIFLDSDDYWHKDCLKNCVENMFESSADVLCFDYFIVFEGESFNIGTWNEAYGYTKNCTISAKQFLEKSIEKNILSFSFAWRGMIDFSYLKSLQLLFPNGIIYEDIFFGSALFMSAKKIYVDTTKLYFYRVRSNSITGFYNKSTISPYLYPLYKQFNDETKCRQYIISISHCVTLLNLIDFISTKSSDKDINKLVLEAFFPNAIKQFTQIISHKTDPLKFRQKLPLLLKYKKYFNRLTMREKIAISYPRFYKIVAILHRIYKAQKNIERKIRKKLRGKQLV
ncbi:MAG: glycosyltransferase [Helicobacteraceae bacterium]|nr:glycosyltransferase [Helicobacteraceae bacterium]